MHTTAEKREKLEMTEQGGHGLTRHSVTVEVVSDGLLQFVVGRGFLEALAQIVLQVLVQLASCHCGQRKQENMW